jgi:hypothetical protein
MDTNHSGLLLVVHGMGRMRKANPLGLRRRVYIRTSYTTYYGRWQMKCSYLFSYHSLLRTIHEDRLYYLLHTEGVAVAEWLLRPTGFVLYEYGC